MISTAPSPGISGTTSVVPPHACKLILTIGNDLMGDDGAGALLAHMLRANPLRDWEILHGGSAPENILHRVRELAPQQALLVDAADMDLPPGSIRLIQTRSLEDPFLLTTHTLPLTFLVEALREFVPQVELLGVQPDIIAFGYPLSLSVRQAVEQIYADLEDGQTTWESL